MHKEALQKSWKRTERSVRNSGAVAELSLWECIRDWASPFKVPKATGATSSLLFCLFLPVYYHLSLNKTSSPSFFCIVSCQFLRLLLFSSLLWLYFAVSLPLILSLVLFPSGTLWPFGHPAVPCGFFVKWEEKHFLCRFFGSSVCHLAVSAIV